MQTEMSELQKKLKNDLYVKNVEFNATYRKKDGSYKKPKGRSDENQFSRMKHKINEIETNIKLLENFKIKFPDYENKFK